MELTFHVAILMVDPPVFDMIDHFYHFFRLNSIAGRMEPPSSFFLLPFHLFC